ncbi:HTH domain-containing protein [Helcococcus ovis]|uniref:HTH domain-containing protein n=1 Tax=Helcococcus ovis TaxID=72026 RepID=UPI0038BD3241
MSKRRYYTDEEKAELLSNPYTFRVTNITVKFTLDFKKFLIKEIELAKLSYPKIFAKAGYRKELFSYDQILNLVWKIKREADSEEGLQEPKLPKRAPVKKKHQATEVKDLEKRILILEQQIEFLKKSQFVRKHGQMLQDNTD